jgi:predicted nucleic acid-binding protein
LTVRPIQDTIRRDYLLSSLDIGESEAIVLAQELRSDWLLLDEIKARSMARRLSIRIAGTGALLGMAKQRGTLPLVKPLLDELVAQDFRISADVYRTILMQNGE